MVDDDLAALVSDPIVVVDVGCRWGFADTWLALGDRSSLIGFDPDKEECGRLQELYADHRNVRVVPVALGAQVGTATLHVTINPSGSSLYPPSDAVGRHRALDGGRVARTIDVPVTTLDSWATSEALERVDVLKLDTQGSELEVLTGAVDVLHSVRAIEIEVEFNPLYEGAALFAEVDLFLRQHGFELWRLKNLVHYDQYSAVRNWSTDELIWFGTERPEAFAAGPGQLFWADAFYVRREMARPEAGTGWQQLVRDAVIARQLGFLDLATLQLLAANLDGAPLPPSVFEELPPGYKPYPGSPPHDDGLAQRVGDLQQKLDAIEASVALHERRWQRLRSLVPTRLLGRDRAQPPA